MTARVIIEADGGSRGNPGPAAYGALIRDADTGEVIAERGETIGIATNNVAEYRGLIAGLEMAREHVPDAQLEVRMDSKLVVEQMAGRWKVKHPSMKPLAIAAQRLVPTGVQWTWVPRAANKAADALVNIALDADAGGRLDTVDGSAATLFEPAADPEPVLEQPVAVPETQSPPMGWRGGMRDTPTTLILLRHGVTESTERKVFCGSGGADPGLTVTGQEQARRAAAWIAGHGAVDAVVSSPLRRARETASVVAAELGLEVAVEAGLAEAAFGEWDGHSFAEIKRRWPAELDAWLGSTAQVPPGGEALDAVLDRVAAAQERILTTYEGRTVVAVSHVTPIKMMVRLALDAPMPVIHKMELAPASITTILRWRDGTSSLRNFSVVPG